MTNEFKLSWNELWPLCNILNEMCHGIGINIEDTIGFTYDDVYPLLKKIKSHEENESNAEMKKEVLLNQQEMLILRRSLPEVFKELEEWEFEIRIGVSIDQVKKIPIFSKTDS